MAVAKVKTLSLIANPGSASRKFALYAGDECRARLHFEYTEGHVRCTLEQAAERQEIHAGIDDVAQAATHALEIFIAQGALGAREHIELVGLRIVAPSSYFLEDRLIDDYAAARLHALLPLSPLHIEATTNELRLLRAQFPAARIFGLSDSGFHITKPDYAWNYGLPLHEADRLDVKRFGFHGLSVASIVGTLQKIDKLPPKLIVCHIGSGVSVTAVHGGKSIDTTMGYSPLEGPIMATRSGSIDLTAVCALKQSLNKNDAEIETYLTKQSGLLGLGGSSDLRELLAREANDDHYAHLALQTYLFTLQKSIGQMAAALGGADVLVFTGTVGERSAPIRQRIVRRLHYLDFILDDDRNVAAETGEMTTISRIAHSKPIYIVPTDEMGQMAKQLLLAAS